MSDLAKCAACGCEEWLPLLVRKCANCGRREDGSDDETTVRTYDPENVKVTFNGIELTGFIDDTFIQAERDATEVRYWKFDVEACLDRLQQYGRKQRRRSRAARKKTRGWA